MSGSLPPLFDSLKRLLDTSVGVMQVRLQLLGTEVEQEKERLVGAFVRAALGLLLLGAALVLAIGFVVLLFWDSYRLPAIGVLAVVLGAGGYLMLQRARSSLDSGPDGPFALSLGELRRDRQGLGDTPPPPP